MKHINIIGEIGINHNGSVKLCKELMLISKGAGLDYVKLQKRNPDVCVPEEQKSKRRMTPWGEMSYLEYKYRVEFNEEQIRELMEYAKEIDIKLFASVWDIDSAKLMLFTEPNNLSPVPTFEAILISKPLTAKYFLVFVIAAEIPPAKSI